MTSLSLRRVLCTALLFAWMPLGAAARTSTDPCAPWPQWQRFEQSYLSEDGRVIDTSTQPGITVSEGQAYALTFALIANDRAAFEKILRWTRDNLANGDLGRSLPAWKWGRRDDGKWGVIDPNSASDADLWIAYALGEAGRLWKDSGHAHLARALTGLIVRDEVSWIPQLGATLLPAPKGFVSAQTWRLNASYSPIQVLRAIATQSDDPLWAEVLQSSTRVILDSAPKGFAADWIAYRSPGGFSVDRSTNGVGGYDAIRVYLWAGMLAQDDPQATALANRLEPMARRAAAGPPPETIDTNTLETHGTASPGFSAALLPLLSHFKYSAAIEASRQRIEAASLADNAHYYSDVLSLFGIGWIDGRYRFDRQGHLQVRWGSSCAAR